MFQLDQVPPDVGALVVAGINDNPRYLDAVPWWFRFWSRVGPRAVCPIHPVLIAINVAVDQVPRTVRPWTKFVTVPASVPTSWAAQMVRLFWPGTLGDWPGRVITTDVDMMPLGTRVFDSIEPPHCAMVVYRDELRGEGQVPICYVSGTPTIWRDVMGNRETLADDLVYEWQTVGEYSSSRGGVGWFSDQELLFRRLTAWEAVGGQVIWLRDESTGHKRLDRSSRVPIQWLFAPAARWGHFTDYHVPLPVGQHQGLLKWQAAWLK